MAQATAERSIESALSHERERRRRSLMRDRRRSQFARAALVGVSAGLLAVFFQRALTGAEFASSSLSSWAHGLGFWGLALFVPACALLAALAAAATARFAPEASGSGIPHVKAVLLRLRPMRWGRVVLVKFFGGVMALASGLSLGREGPTVQMGAALGEAWATWLRVPKRSHATLIACGAGAGLAAAFNAPLAGFLFVIEELQRELSPTTYGAALIASVCGDAVARFLVGQEPAFRITGYPTPPLSQLPLFAVLGLAAGFLGVAFNKSLLIVSGGMRRIPRPWLRGVLAGTVAGFALWFLPEVAGGGHRTAELVLSGKFASSQLIGVVLLLMVAKYAFTMVSYGSGVPGGIFAPMLVVGAFAGLALGGLFSDLFPAMHVSPAAFAVVGMAALFTSVVRAPLTGIILIVEMTANYRQLYALLVACLISYLVADSLRDKPIYEALLDRDLHRREDVGDGGEPILVDLHVEPGSFLDGRRVRDLGLPEGCLLVSVRSGERETIPSGGTRLAPGDVLTLIAEADESEAVQHLAEAARAQPW